MGPPTCLISASFCRRLSSGDTTQSHIQGGQTKRGRPTCLPPCRMDKNGPPPSIWVQCNKIRNGLCMTVYTYLIDKI